MTDDSEPRLRETILVTGFPAFTARRMVQKILAADEDARLYLLARTKFEEAAGAFLASLPRDQAERATLVVGDVCDMDLGLAGGEYRALAAEITTIHHLAGIYFLGVDKATARAVNVEGTRGVVELAADCRKLRRLCHWSTATVAGKRTGMILEEELDRGQGFHNIYEETKFQAEKLARAAQRHMPVTIVRPSLVVGDSRTGEIDKFDGPYYLMVLVATNQTQLSVPLPGRGRAPLHLVPIDYAIDAAYALSIDERAAGKTFHLTDPDPLPARRIYELVAEYSRTKAPRSFGPGLLARVLLRAPGIERLARGPLSFLDSFDQRVFYSCRQTREILAGTGIDCPPFESYVENLVRYVCEVHADRRARAGDDDADPLD